jgi:hypothetical protein
MSDKCKTLILGKGKNFSSDDETFEKQKQQLKECRKQKFETFAEKFKEGFKTSTGAVKGVTKGAVKGVTEAVGKLSKDK